MTHSHLYIDSQRQTNTRILTCITPNTLDTKSHTYIGIFKTLRSIINIFLNSITNLYTI